MPLSKEVVEDQITILEDGQIQVREVTRIIENGKILSFAYHRRVIVPDADTANENARLKSITDTVFTPVVKAAWIAKQQSPVI